MVHTVRAFRIDPGCVERFLRSMAMDLTVETYETYEDLLVYMDGSAAVIGEMMLPILEPTDPAAPGPARELGNAFQLTNFLRRSEEHTSELQSLMRISYAVFCLKQKNKHAK